MQLTALANADSDTHLEGLVFAAVAIFGVLLVIVAHAAVLTSGRSSVRGFASGSSGLFLGLKNAQRRYYQANVAPLAASTMQVPLEDVATLPQFVDRFDERMAAGADPPVKPASGRPSIS